MSRSKRIWGAVALVAALVMVGGGVALYPYFLGPWARLARIGGYNPFHFVPLRAMQEKASRENRLSSREVSRLARYAADQDPRLRMRALTALRYLGGTPQAGQAMAIARTRLTDPEPGPRKYALAALYYLDAPDFAAVAERALEDPDDRVRDWAEKALRKKGAL